MSIRTFGLALLLMGAAACTPMTKAALGPAPVAGQTVVDEKMMAAAETLYNVPANAYVVADGNGLLKPELKAVVKPIMLKMYDALQSARAAKRVGDASGFMERYNALKDLSERASALIPKGN